ncbi:hypothetical protein EDD90_3312 [Streptomyces sp. Ag109_O5-1]|uniref:hypothetical protein n=1 Tax=Streptomyces sp. Ag109_O5-1 TaxID=1938851 RepID=UPI000F50EEE2|nr:hypothetical protein [Streptomyces sp. Ag109_O5-1]RPE40276.1 hypothetical protein EDD90_3312 [Streptomyces sp. Ag109_O5-1]
MGFERNPKVYHLKWQDGEYAGLEVRVRTVNMGQLLAMRTGSEGKDSTQVSVDYLAERIVDWNLTSNGVPVPPTLENILAEDDDFVLAIITKWSQAISGVSAPLPESSPSGEPSPEESVIPMAPLSASQAS